MSRLPGPLAVQPISLCLSAAVNSGRFLTSYFLLLPLLWKLFELLVSFSLPLFLPHPPTFSPDTSSSPLRLRCSLSVRYTHNQDTFSALTSGLADLALGGML